MPVQGASMTGLRAAGADTLADDLEDARARLTLLKSQNGQLSRLTAMERIALDFAHELNQPLAAVVSYVRAGQRLIADRQKPDLDRLAVALEGAMTQSLHASHIVNRVRAFVTHGETEKGIERLATIVQAALTLSTPDTQPYGVHVSLALDEACALVLVDRVQIQQVLVNLIRNAAQAMQDCPRRELCIASRLIGDDLEISVADSGQGVPPAIRDRLFEPFMTTRSAGTGLGLTICNAIVEAHGGTMSYEPAPDGGSIFRFTVTAVADAVR
jgi:two-component system sensor kinase FixL